MLILADDLGTADVGAYGGRVARTPRLDALAAARAPVLAARRPVGDPRGPLELVHSQAFWNDPGLGSGLYDLEADPGETRDLSAEQPGRVEALTRAQRAWRAGL